MSKMKEVAIRLSEALGDEDFDDFAMFLETVRNDPELKGFILRALDLAEVNNDEKV